MMVFWNLPSYDPPEYSVTSEISDVPPTTPPNSIGFVHAMCEVSGTIPSLLPEIVVH